MKIKRITDKVSVSPQIAGKDVAEIKAAGFRAIICNRPDGEGADQPSFEEIEEAAKKAGLVVAYLPITQGMVSGENVDASGAVLKDLPRPVLGYFWSGKCSAALWSLHEAKKHHCPKSSPQPRPQAVT